MDTRVLLRRDASRGRCRACTIALVALLALSAAAWAQAPVLDQEQTVVSPTGETIAVYHQARIAQTFTAGITGSLVRADLRIGVFHPAERPSDPGTLQVEIRSTSAGVPTTPLALEGVDPALVPVYRPPSPPPAFISITFEPPVSVSAGTKYAIVSYATPNIASDYEWAWSGRFTDPYPRGEAMHTPIFPGVPENWRPELADMVFRTYVAPTSVRPTNKSQCKRGGWRRFTNPSFKNQGQCVKFVNHQSRQGANGNGNEERRGKKSDKKPS